MAKLIFSEKDSPSPLVGKTLGRVAIASLFYVKVRVCILSFTRAWFLSGGVNPFQQLHRREWFEIFFQCKDLMGKGQSIFGEEIQGF